MPIHTDCKWKGTFSLMFVVYYLLCFFLVHWSSYPISLDVNRPQGSVYVGRHRTQKIMSPPVGFTEEPISCSYQGATKSKEIMQLREGNVFTDVCVSTVGLLGASHASWDRSHSRVPSPRTWDLGTSPPHPTTRDLWYWDLVVHLV